MKIALGSAKFGLKYGIGESAGKVDIEAARKIIRLAETYQIKTIDTAVLYGESQEALGRIGVEKWAVITKLPKMPNNCSDIKSWAYDNIIKSLTTVKIDCFEGVLVHDSEQLMGYRGDKLKRALNDIKSDGLTKKLGVSIYDPIEVSRIQMKIDILQFPLNIFDRRFIDRGIIDSLSTEGVEMHARSIFLQGLLLMDKNKIPKYFNKWRYVFNEYDKWLKINKTNKLDAAISFVKNTCKINKIIIGVDSYLQLKMIVDAYNRNFTCDEFLVDLIDLDNLINPRVWSNE